MNISEQIIKVPEQYESVKVVKVKVKKRQAVTPSSIICTLEASGRPEIHINGPGFGKVTMLCQEGCTIGPNEPLFKYEGCGHHVVMRDLCAECGANLRKEGGQCGERITAASASIPMVHMIPDLHVSESVAAELALKDEESLLAARKLALLIDLDQTVLHTTTIPHAFRYKNVHRFNLAGCEMMYHTRFRPHLAKFLRRMVKRFQMHICTFGNRAYAHQLASILDPKRKYFCQRILSRDECFNPVTKSANLRALFPRGFHLVCIIDDRGDVWDWSPNLIQVQPYRFFPEVGDINGPPGRPLSMMPMPDFRAFNPPSPTGTSTSTDTSNSSDEEGPSSSSNFSKLGKIEANPGKIDEPAAVLLDYTTVASKPLEKTTPSESSQRSFKSSEEASVPTEQPKPIKSSEMAESSNSAGEEVKAEPDTELAKSTKEEGGEKKPPVDAPAKERSEGEALNYPPLCTSPLPPPLSPSPSIFEMSEEALDAFDADYLLRLEEILTEIHRRYYRAYDKYIVNRRKEGEISAEKGSRLSGIPHVANVMSQMRARVLGPNTHITLSGLTQRNRPAFDSLAGQIALGLGATLHNRLRLPKQPLTADKSTAGHRAFTTHLVACRQNTEKVLAARAFQAQCVANSPHPPPLHVVSPRWLWASHFRWERLSESQFPLDHDYDVHLFDPDSNLPAAMHGRSRHHRHQHYRRRHYQHRIHPQIPLERDEAEAMLRIANLPEKEELSSAMVRSAIESIKQEMRDRRGHNRDCERTERRQKRTLSESAGSSSNWTAKRTCLRKSDSHLDLDDEGRSPGEHSASPSLSSTDEENDSHGNGIGEEGEDLTGIETKEVDVSPPDVEDNPDHVAIISDSDEEGLDSTFEDDGADMDTEVGKESVGAGNAGRAEQTPFAETAVSSAVAEENLKEEMKLYLPPPCPLEYAENPLLHMSPQAASQMLDEVEEAVLEEREERAASVPREMEDEVSSSSSSSSSSISPNRKRRTKQALEDDDDVWEEDGGEDNDDEDEDDSANEDRGAARRDLEQEERWLRIRQQLLLRRCGTNRRALAKVERRLRQIARTGYAGARIIAKVDHERRETRQHHRHHRHPLHLTTQSAARLSDELADHREFNTCPEGYDYVDAERARELLRPETTRQEVRADAHSRVADGGNEDASDDDDEEEGVGRSRRRKGRKKKKKKRVIGAAGYLEASLFGTDVSSSSSSTDLDESGGGAGDENGIIRSDALKEFM